MLTLKNKNGCSPLNPIGSVINNSTGFTLVELLVSLLVLSILTIAIYSLILLSLKITADNSYIVAATEIANQKMEDVRNLRYEDVGTLTGSPPGLIQEHQTVSRNGMPYDVHTMVIYYDDPYDGTLAAGTDPVFTDYKIATIDVSWQGRFGPKKITVFSKIVPNTEETLAGYGLLKMITVDAGGSVVPNAAIHIENSSPLISADYVSDSGGLFNLPLLPDYEGYEVTVTKTGYSTDKTYARDSINLNPTKPNLSIFTGVKTEASFSIDRQATLNLRTVADSLPVNWQVNSASANDSLNARVAIDQNDNSYFVWQNNGSSTSIVLTQKYNSANARQWSPEVAIETTTDQANPDIAATKAGVAYVVWQDNSVDLKQLAYNTGGHKIKTPKLQPQFAYEANNQVLASLQTGLISKIISFFKSLLAFGSKQLETKSAEAALTNVAIVQTKISGAVNNNSSITATFDSAPAPGDVIIAIAVQSNAGKSFSAPTNSKGTFTVAKYSDSAWQLDTGIWYKVTGASEPKAITINSSGNVTGGILMIMEISGLDTSNPLNVASANDQTGNTGVTATTGQTAVSTANGFAVAASAFSNNTFNAPTNSSWTSGSASSWVQTLWTSWSTGNHGSLAVAAMNISVAAQQSATLALTGGGAEERNSSLAVFNALPLNLAIASASGSPAPNLIMPLSNYYSGGNFIITENSSGRNVNSIKLQEYGTVDAQAKISSVKLFYDLDTTAPYDCADETYNPGTDPQFGSSATFNGPNGYAQFTQAGGVNLTAAKTLCLYPVVSLSGANNNDTLAIRINNPSTDITVSSGSVIPATAIGPGGATTLTVPADVRQIHARLRNDDGDEVNASWKQPQDSSGTMKLNENLRLRFEMTNLGGTTSVMTYRLEYGQLSTSCDDISVWRALPTDNSLAWKINNSAYLTDSAPSTNVVNGLTDENSIFLSGQLKDSGNQTATLTLGPNNFTETEFNVQPDLSAGDKSYCFRLTNQGDASAITYNEYAVVSVKGDENIFIRALNADGSFAWPTKKVNVDLSEADQTNPVIALTENFGTATTAVAWVDNRNSSSDIYLQILDKDGNRKLAADLRVTNSTDNESAPALAFDSLDNLYVAWVRSALSQDIYLSKFDGLGNLLLGPVALEAGGAQEYSPKILFDAANNLFLSYTEETGGLKKIKLVKYDANLTPLWLKNPSADSLAFNQSDCRLGLNGTTLYAVWTDDRNGDKDIYAQKIDASGNLLWPTDLKLNIGLDTAEQISPAVAVKSNLAALGAWQDYRGGKSEIYASEFSDPANLIGVANVPLEIVGTKKIGDNPIIYKYNLIKKTDAGGNLELQLDWDVPGYSVAIHAASSSKTIILKDPPQPLKLLPADNKTMLIYVQ